MAAYTPILVLGGLSAANAWYTDPDKTTAPAAAIKPLVATALAAALAAGFARIPNAEPAVTAIGWIALVSWLVVTAGNKNSLVSTVTSLTATA